METPKGTHNRRVLAAINALLEGKATKDVQSYEIKGRQLEKMSLEDLLKWKAVYTSLCVNEARGSAFGQITFR